MRNTKAGLPGKTSRSMARLKRSTRGAGLVEYGLLVGLISVVAIGAVTQTGRQIADQFFDTADELRIAQLIATAEYVHYLPNDDVFPAQSCFQGSAEADTLPTDAPEKSKAADCFFGNGGGDAFALASGPARDILVALGTSGQTVVLPDGDHWIVGPETLNSITAIQVGSGSSLMDLRPWALSDLSFSLTFGTDLEIVAPQGGAIQVLAQYPGESVGRFVFADADIGAGEIRRRVVDAQSTPNADTLTGTSMDDTFIYRGGNDRILDPNEGFDTLDLSAFTRAQATFMRSMDSIRITLPSGTIMIDDQLDYPVGDTTIDRIVFSGGEEMTDAEIRAALP